MDQLGKRGVDRLATPPRPDLYFQRMLDNLPAAAYTCDPTGLITYFNEQAVSVWGRAPKLEHPDDRFCGSFKLLAGDGSPLQHDECWMAMALRDETGYNGEEIVVEQPNGRRLTVLAYANPIHDESGQLIGAINTLVDITERKSAEAALVERNELLELILTAGTSLASELDLQKLVQLITDLGVEATKAQFGAFFYNQFNEKGESYTLYTLSGAAPEDFQGYPMPRNTHVFGPTFRGEGVVLSDDITRDNRYGQNAPYFGMPKGHLPVRSYLAVPVTSRSGEVLGGLFFGHGQPGVFGEQSKRFVTGIAGQAAVAIDNARLYERVVCANEVLEQSVADRTAELKGLNEELEAFNYSLAHDLRGSLRGIDGFSQVILDECGEALGEDGHHYLQRVRQAALHMGHLLDNLLELSAVVRTEPRRKSVELDELAKAVVARLLEAEPGREAEFRTDDDVEVNCDEGLLRIVLENLLGNAMKYTRGEERALIELGAREHDGVRHYFVRDNGVGFDMDYADKLFEPFQRLHGPTEFEGTGIGLATVRRIIRKHGGRLWAESAPGRGATFYFTLDDRTHSSSPN